MVTHFLDGDGADGDEDGDARRRRRGADTSYQRDDDVARPSTEQSTVHAELPEEKSAY